MITNTGKKIIGKYLLGQTTGYASYIAVGCGAKPLLPYVSGSTPDYSEKTELDFEMFRVPISSRGFIDEDGKSKVVFTAELPTEERYEITEIGVYSAASNPAAGSIDSKSLLSFSENENWKINGTSSLDSISERLDDPLVAGVIRDSFNIDGVSKSLNIFETNADNRIFSDNTRILRNERPRFLNNAILIRGNSSTFTGSDGSLIGGGNFIQLSGTSVDLSKNSPSDELRMAFSLVNKDSSSPSITGEVKIKILIDFSSSTIPDQYSRFEAIVSHDSESSQYNFNTNRYFTVSKKIENINTTSGFAWKSVDTIKVYAQVLTGASTADTVDGTYYVALDSIRLENKTSYNPLYGLIGYSVIRSADALPIVKSPNTSNYVEFRFIMDVL